MNLYPADVAVRARALPGAGRAAQGAWPLAARASRSSEGCMAWAEAAGNGGGGGGGAAASGGAVRLGVGAPLVVPFGCRGGLRRAA